ncbi:hypothetical protein BJX63DRAFT_152647 [Aspergillus granulosus]|uniref:Uncharacterized protein n=1 Tax=Aspergillus granulosus TaxID=176169 RepID=A0ABR4HK97_9EURO
MQSPTPSTKISPLQAHVDTLHSLPLEEIIQALHALLPHFTTSITPTGTRLVHSHPKYLGEAKLDDLGKLYLSSATRCTREHASCKTRLLHTALDKIIEELYNASEDQLRAGLKDGSVNIPPLGPDDDRGCACCRGDPDAVILCGFHIEESLHFWEDEYKSIWGEEPNTGGIYGSDYTWLKASKEQVEREAAKQEEIASKL